MPVRVWSNDVLEIASNEQGRNKTIKSILLYDKVKSNRKCVGIYRNWHGFVRVFMCVCVPFQWISYANKNSGNIHKSSKMSFRFLLCRKRTVCFDSYELATGTNANSDGNGCLILGKLYNFQEHLTSIRNHARNKTFAHLAKCVQVWSYAHLFKSWKFYCLQVWHSQALCIIPLGGEVTVFGRYSDFQQPITTEGKEQNRQTKWAQTNIARGKHVKKSKIGEILGNIWQTLTLADKQQIKDTIQNRKLFSF